MNPVEVKKELRAISDEGDNDVDVDVDGDFVNDEWSNVADYSDDVDKNDNDVDFDVDIAATSVVRKSANQSRKKKTLRRSSAGCNDKVVAELCSSCDCTELDQWCPSCLTQHL